MTWIKMKLEKYVQIYIDGMRIGAMEDLLSGGGADFRTTW